jgi:hypothetical protein
MDGSLDGMLFPSVELPDLNTWTLLAGTDVMKQL